MGAKTLLTWTLGMMIAVATSVSVTLIIYYLGHPMVALALSSPIGLTVGITAGLIIRQRLGILTT